MFTPQYSQKQKKFQRKFKRVPSVNHNNIKFKKKLVFSEFIQNHQKEENSSFVSNSVESSMISDRLEKNYDKYTITSESSKFIQNGIMVDLIPKYLENICAGDREIREVLNNYGYYFNERKINFLKKKLSKENVTTLTPSTKFESLHSFFPQNRHQKMIIPLDIKKKFGCLKFSRNAKKLEKIKNEKIKEIKENLEESFPKFEKKSKEKNLKLSFIFLTIGFIMLPFPPISVFFLFLAFVLNLKTRDYQKNQFMKYANSLQEKVEAFNIFLDHEGLGWFNTAITCELVKIENISGKEEVVIPGVVFGPEEIKEQMIDEFTNYKFENFEEEHYGKGKISIDKFKLSQLKKFKYLVKMNLFIFIVSKEKFIEKLENDIEELRKKKIEEYKLLDEKTDRKKVVNLNKKIDILSSDSGSEGRDPNDISIDEHNIHQGTFTSPTERRSYFHSPKDDFHKKSKFLKKRLKKPNSENSLALKFKARSNRPRFSIFGNYSKFVPEYKAYDQLNHQVFSISRLSSMNERRQNHKRKNSTMHHFGKIDDDNSNENNKVLSKKNIKLTDRLKKIEKRFSMFEKGSEEKIPEEVEREIFESVDVNLSSYQDEDKEEKLERGFTKLVTYREDEEVKPQKNMRVKIKLNRKKRKSEFSAIHFRFDQGE